MMVLRPTEVPRLPGVHTLVLEDDAFLRDGVSDLLELEGADVSSAATGNTGFARFLQDCPDVIVSDLSMPDGSGYDFIEHVRDLPPERGGLTPAIAVSATDSTGKALMAGFHVFLAKPFDPFRLVETIAEFTKHQDAQALAPWTISRLEAGRLVLTLIGRVGSGDVPALTDALANHLDAGRLDLVLDLRRMTRCSPSLPSLAERALWSRRRQIRSVRVVGGSSAAFVVATAACKILDVAVTFSSDPT